jgi:hypothetical protein
MNRVPLLLVLASSCAVAQPTPTPAPSSDAASILAPVISNQLRIYGGKPVPCVMRKFAGVAFDSEHMEAGGTAGANAAAHVPTYRWTLPSTVAQEFAKEATLLPDEARTLSEAEADIIRGPAQRQTADTIQAGWVPKPLQLCANEKRLPVLNFSAPAVRGDVAFVEAGYVCGGLCGNGLLYALRRTGSEWRIVSVVFTWIS